MNRLENQWKWIDKTRILKDAIRKFPSIYIEGAAASGKTILIYQMIANHPDVVPVLFSLEKNEWSICQNETDKECWYIIEDLQNAGKKQLIQICDWIEKLPEGHKVIMSGRDELPQELFKLYWNRKIEIIPHKKLCFNLKEIQELITRTGTPLQARELYEITGGWPGCTDVILRIASYSKEDIAQGHLLSYCENNYILKKYIENEVINPLKECEKRILQIAAVSSWINPELCAEVLKESNPEMLLVSLERKGYLIQDETYDIWKILPIIKNNIKIESKIIDQMPTLLAWYEKKQDYTAVWNCLKQIQSPEEIIQYSIAYFDKWNETVIEEMMPYLWSDQRPEIQYLKALYCYYHKDFNKISEYRLQVESDEANVYTEILANIMWLDPSVSLIEWMDWIKNRGECIYKIYEPLAGSFSYLCGSRDVSVLFACNKKEEQAYKRFWKHYMGEQEQINYQLAKVEYYIESERIKEIGDEIKELFYLKQRGVLTKEQEHVLTYLIYRVEVINNNNISEALPDKNNDMYYCSDKTILSKLYAFYKGSTDELAIWLKETEEDNKETIKASNVWYMMHRVKGYLLLNQYDIGNRISERICQYIPEYRAYRLEAECYYQQAIIQWEKGSKGLALRSAIACFIICNKFRYVDFFISYGSKRIAILQDYMSWQEQNNPGKWQHKKKYQYGNVYRMTDADYVDYLCRKIKKTVNKITVKTKSEERLTMMETIILQNIAKGMKNEDIAEELHIQLSTVKTHIYNLYKKLGVKSRIQAINKGKELGIV